MRPWSGLPAAPQRGALAIVLAFMLLVLMTGAAFATNRNVVRELILGGELVQGAKAAAAAEAGLDWFLAWSAGPGNTGGDWSNPLLAGLETGASGAGAPEATATVVGAGLLAKAPDSGARQGYRVRIQHLGSLPQCTLGQGGHPAGPADPSALPVDHLWLVTAVGRCQLALSGSRGQDFLQVRELLASAPSAALASLAPEPLDSRDGSAPAQGEAEPSTVTPAHGW